MKYETLEIYTPEKPQGKFPQGQPVRPVIPWPSWICQGQDGGARVGREPEVTEIKSEN